MPMNVAAYLNTLNLELLTRLQNSGEAYLSNAVIHGKFALRACIVNFRTSLADVEALLPIVLRIGKELDAALRPGNLRDSDPRSATVKRMADSDDRSIRQFVYGPALLVRI